MTALLTPGIHYGVPFSHYLADPGVSNSMLSAMRKSPAHCYALYLDPERPQQEDTPAMSGGRMTHCFVLERHEFDNRYAVKPEGMSFASKDGKSWRDAVEPGKEIVTLDAYKGARAQAEALMRVKCLRDSFASGRSEVTVIWIDKETGIRCKARPDHLHFTTSRSVRAVDLKTINDLTHDSVNASVGRYGYHRQQAHYTNGLRAVGLNVEEFVFAFVSAGYPYLAAGFVIDEEDAEQGHDEVADLLRLYAECSKSGHFPGLGDGYQLASLPKYAKQSKEVEVSYV